MAKCMREGHYSWFVLMVMMLAGLIAGLPRMAVAQTSQPAVSESSLDQQFLADYKALVDVGDRTVGSAGYEKAAAYIQEQVKSISGTLIQQHDFNLAVPIMAKPATLGVPGRPEALVYPIWPAGIRVNATPEEGISGKLVYLGDCLPSQINPEAVRGQIAVVEVTAGTRWSQAFYYGAKAMIILGKPRVSNTDLQHQEESVPVDFPRFYLPAGDLAAAIRAGKITDTGTLKAAVNWEKKTAHNFYVLIPGKTKGKAALTFSANYESNSLVVGLAPGASQAVQAAAGLSLVREFAANPPDRPVLVFFSGGDSIQFQATREMLLALSNPPREWQAMLDVKDTGVADQLKTIDRDIARLTEIEPDPQKLDPKADRPQIDRIVQMINTDMAANMDDLFRLRTAREEDLGEDSKAQSDALRKTLEDRQVDLSDIKANLMEPKKLTGDAPRMYVQQAIGRLKDLQADTEHRRQALQRRIDLYNWLAKELKLPNDPGTSGSNSIRLLEVLVGLDFSDSGVRFGPVTYGYFTRYNGVGSVQNFRDYFERLRVPRGANGQPDWFVPLAGRVDFAPLSGSQSPQTWLGGPLPLPSEMADAFALPGMSLVTLDDLREMRDSPTDTPENLNLDRIAPQVAAARVLMLHAWANSSFVGGTDMNWRRSSFSGQVVGSSPGSPVPDLPRPGYLAITGYAGGVALPASPRVIPYSIGIRRNQVLFCDAEGNYRCEGYPTLVIDYNQLYIAVYRLDADTGMITAASDMGRQATDLPMFLDLSVPNNPLRSLVFDCSPFSLSGLYDPRYLQDLGTLIPLDGRRNAAPQRYHGMIGQQLLAGFMEPDASAYLVFRYGRVGNRLLLLNMRDPKNPANRGKSVQELAAGFRMPQLQAMDPLAFVTAQDFNYIDESRLSSYAEAGVKSQQLDDLHAEATRGLLNAGVTSAAGRGMKMLVSSDLKSWMNVWQPFTAADMVRETNNAWATEARVYSAAADMANDVVRAAIFLLLVCVPFSFCVERLLIGSPNIYRQLLGLFVIFSIMAAALWSFHPAFKISTSPLIIILAFAIIFMSLVTISVVYGKFDSELKRISSGRGTVEGASFARASVLMSAVMLGIANMRRRKFRTALTSITIVLITFAVLCFTSTSRFLDVTTLPTREVTRYPGVMMRQRGFRPMPPIAADNLKAVVGDKHQVVQEWWTLNAADPHESINLVAPSVDGTVPPRVTPMSAILGLSPGESQLNEIGKVIGETKFAHLENGETDVIYISTLTAEQLGVSEGQTILLAGIPLKVAGIYKGIDFDQQVLALSGDPISPLKYSTGALDAGGRQLSDTAAESLDMDSGVGASELSSSYEHLSSTQFAIVPAAVSRKLPNSTLRMLAVKFENETEVKRWATELSRRFAVALFAGYNDGVKMVSASNLSSVSGKQVVIPLAIAGLIIFNTMMGSIAERKREIHVYTSLGLAPVHVGALFVAEALTYGLLGTVFGYVIGQGAGTFLSYMDWMGGVTLNYSGSSAMMTMGLILVIVFLSALVPARMASKIAAPSIERTWRVPAPEGSTISAHLPFTINKTAADGALAYLAEFFESHLEGSIGKFSSGKIEFVEFKDASGQRSRGLKAIIWLTPFDLGVRQELTLAIHPGQFEDIYEVQVILVRLSGDDGSWYRMNRSFLTELRKQFLQWRSLSPQRMREYVQASHTKFDQIVPQDAPLKGNASVGLA